MSKIISINPPDSEQQPKPAWTRPTVLSLCPPLHSPHSPPHSSPCSPSRTLPHSLPHSPYSPHSPHPTPCSLSCSVPHSSFLLCPSPTTLHPQLVSLPSLSRLASTQDLYIGCFLFLIFSSLMYPWSLSLPFFRPLCKSHLLSEALHANYTENAHSLPHQLFTFPSLCYGFSDLAYYTYTHLKSCPCELRPQ